MIHTEGSCHLIVHNTTVMNFQGPELSLNHLSFFCSLVKPVVHPNHLSPDFCEVHHGCSRWCRGVWGKTLQFFAIIEGRIIEWGNRKYIFSGSTVLVRGLECAKNIEGGERRNVIADVGSSAAAWNCNGGPTVRMLDVKRTVYLNHGILRQ